MAKTTPWQYHGKTIGYDRGGQAHGGEGALDGGLDRLGDDLLEAHPFAPGRVA